MVGGVAGAAVTGRICRAQPGVAVNGSDIGLLHRIRVHIWPVGSAHLWFSAREVSRCLDLDGVGAGRVSSATAPGNFYRSAPRSAFVSSFTSFGVF